MSFATLFVALVSALSRDPAPSHRALDRPAMIEVTVHHMPHELGGVPLFVREGYSPSVGRIRVGTDDSGGHGVTSR